MNLKLQQALGQLLDGIKAGDGVALTTHDDVVISVDEMYANHLTQQVQLLAQSLDPNQPSDTLTQVVEHLHQLRAIQTPSITSASQVSNTASALEPTVLRTDTGHGLLYPGSSHLLSAPPKQGKSFLALLATLQEARAGGHVVYYDLENDDRTLVRRLRSIGATDQDLARITLVRGSSGTTLAFLRQVCRERQASLCIVDGLSILLSGAGLDENSNVGVGSFWTREIEPIATAGASVLVLHHTTKAGESPRGASALNAVVTGASLTMLQDKRWSKHKSGSAVLSLQGDRHGAIESAGDIVATLCVTPRPDGLELQLLDATHAAARQLINLHRACEPGSSHSRTDLLARAGASPDLLSELVKAGHLVAKPHGAGHSYTRGAPLSDEEALAIAVAML